MGKQIDFSKYSLEEFQNLELFYNNGEFTDIVIIPMEKTKNEKFKEMKFYLYNQFTHENVGVIGGEQELFSVKNYYDMGIDCLAGSNCIRLSTPVPRRLSILSDYDFSI